MRVLQLAGRPLPYALVRHPRARHVRITVRPDGVRVSAPPRHPLREIEAFMRLRAEWILDHVERLAAAAPPPLADGARLPLLGGEVELGVRAARRNRIVFREEDARLSIEIADPVHLDGLVESWYRRLAARHFGALSEARARAMGLRYTRLGVRDGRTRWASCSARGALNFSWRLMMAPHRVGEYVVVHELAHLVEMNHSPAFWAVVAGQWPGWQADRAWLRRHGASLERGPAALAASAARG